MSLINLSSERVYGGTQESASNPSHFGNSFREPVTIRPGQTVTLLSLSFNKDSQLDIGNTNNTMYFRIGKRSDAFLLKKIVVPDGSYTPAELCTQLSKALNDATTIDYLKGFTVKYSSSDTDNLITFDLTLVTTPEPTPPEVNTIQVYKPDNSPDTAGAVGVQITGAQTDIRQTLSSLPNTDPRDHAGPLLTTKTGVFSNGGELSAIVKPELLVSDMTFTPGDKWTLPSTFSTTYAAALGGGASSTATYTPFASPVRALSFAFDNIIGTYGNPTSQGWYTANNALDKGFVVDFQSGKRIGRISYYRSPPDIASHCEAPRFVEISGSHSGTGFTVLYSNVAGASIGSPAPPVGGFTYTDYPQATVGDTASDHKDKAKNYDFVNQTAYRYYKMRFTDKVAPHSQSTFSIGASEIVFYEATLAGGDVFEVQPYAPASGAPNNNYDFMLVGNLTLFCVKLKGKTVTATAPATYIDRQKSNYLAVMGSDTTQPGYDDLTLWDRLLQLTPDTLGPDFKSQLYALVDLNNTFSLTLQSANRAAFLNALTFTPSMRYPNCGIGLIRAPLGDPNEIPVNPLDHQKIILQNVADTNYPNGTKNYSDYSLNLIGSTATALSVQCQNVLQRSGVTVPAADGSFPSNWRSAESPTFEAPVSLDRFSSFTAGTDDLKLTVTLTNIREIQFHVSHNTAADRATFTEPQLIKSVSGTGTSSRLKEWFYPVLGSLWFQGAAYNQATIGTVGIFGPAGSSALKRGVATGLHLAQSEVDTGPALGAAPTLDFIYKLGHIPDSDIGSGPTQLRGEDVVGTSGPGSADPTLNDANIDETIGFPNLVNGAAASFKVDGGNVASGIHTPSLVLEVPELGTMGWNSTTQNRNNAIAYVPSEEINTNEQSGLLHYTPNFPSPMKIRVPTETRLNMMTVKISTTDEKSPSYLLQSPVNVALRID